LVLFGIKAKAKKTEDWGLSWPEGNRPKTGRPTGRVLEKEVRKKKKEICQGPVSTGEVAFTTEEDGGIPIGPVGPSGREGREGYQKRLPKACRTRGGKTVACGWTGGFYQQGGPLDIRQPR